MLMWLGDPRPYYKHPEKLDEMMQVLLADYQTWKQHYSIEQDGVIPDPDQPGWMAFNVIDAKKIEEGYFKGWENSGSLALQMPGILNMFINFIRPGQILRDHCDIIVWKHTRKKLNNPMLNGYTISFAIDMPVPDQQPLIFDGKKMTWSTGEFRAFNGIMTHHSVENNCQDNDHWRVTGLIDIDVSYWNVPTDAQFDN